MPSETIAGARPVPRWLRVATILAAGGSGVVMLWAAAHPTGNFTAGFWALVIGAVAGILWLTALVVAVRRRHRAISLVAAPLVVLATYGLAATPAPEQASFVLARPALERALRDGTCPPTVGVLPVLTCQPFGRSGQAYLVAGAGFLNQAGWVHIADPAEAEEYRHRRADEASTVTELGDGWYRLVVVW